MKTLLGLGLLFVVAAPVCAAGASRFAVDLVNPSHANLFVDGAWDRDAGCLQVKLSVQEEAADPVVKAYFYGADGMLLHTANKPSSQGDGKSGIVKLPTQFEKGKQYEVFFGIPKAAERWKRVVFVFGKPGEYTAQVYPNDDLAKFNFPEKASATVSASPAQAAQASGFEVDLVNPSRAYLLVDEAWQRNAECLQVKVSVQADVSDPVFKAYFYGADGKLLHTEKRPSLQTDGQGSQMKIPTRFEKGRRYEVFFGIPMAAEKWKRAVIVFGKPGEYAAKIYPKDDIAKFDFPENAFAVAAAPAPAQASHVPAPNKSVPEWEALKGQFDARVKVEVQQPFEAGLKDLNAKYIVALERAQENAQKYGKLEEAVAIKADREAVATGRGVPAADDNNTLPVVKQLRGTYRVAFNRLEEDRVRRLQPVQGPFIRSLDALVTGLTREGKLEEAMSVKYQREQLTGPVAAPAVLGQLAVTTPSANTPATTPADASESGDLLVNSLGMKFVAVPGTGVLMCIHETRRRDYAAFAASNPRGDDSWKSPREREVPVSTGDEHPVVAVSYEDAAAFCAWLGKKEGRVYRLPTDREWSMAVGIGDKESPNDLPFALNERLKNEYPWGTEWPPPKGSANIRDSSFDEEFPPSGTLVAPEGYADGYATTAPVMSFSPNKLGIYDLAGNVRELCSDWFETQKGTRVARGGNYGSVRGGVLSSYRMGSTGRLPGIGFRCVVEAPQNSAAPGDKAADAAGMESEDLVVSGKKFAEATLRNNELAYGNREYVWSKVPESLSGSRYTKIDGGAAPEIKVRAKRDTVVRILTDVSERIKPDLAGWERTDLQFTFSTHNNPKVIVHERKLSAGQELEVPQGNWSGALVLLPPAETSTSAGVKAPELSWLIGKTWSTDAGNTLEFSTGGSGERTTKSGKTPITWRILPSGLVEVAVKESSPLKLFVEIKNASEGAFGTSEADRTVQIHVK